MALSLSIQQHKLEFLFEAKTSRNSFREKDFLVITLKDEDGKTGIGEVAPLEGLSPESLNECIDACKRLEEQIRTGFNLDEFINSTNLPSSVLFGLEMALHNLKEKKKDMYFSKGVTGLKKGLQINGLIWMGDFDFMKQQALDKIKKGFRCIKVKIGGIEKARELELIEFIRNEGGPQIEIRLDANEAFTFESFQSFWKELSPFKIHSIEQPIARNQWKGLRELGKEGIPVALDEELISVVERAAKEMILEEAKPKFIVLKPTLHGGFSGSQEWIDLAESRGIGWWITSALESNLGLSAIAQFAAQYENPLAQGLGTGGLYRNNFETPLKRVGDTLTWET